MRLDELEEALQKATIDVRVAKDSNAKGETASEKLYGAAVMNKLVAIKDAAHAKLLAEQAFIHAEQLFANWASLFTKHAIALIAANEAERRPDWADFKKEEYVASLACDSAAEKCRKYVDVVKSNEKNAAKLIGCAEEAVRSAQAAAEQVAVERLRLAESQAAKVAELERELEREREQREQRERDAAQRLVMLQPNFDEGFDE